MNKNCFFSNAFKYVEQEGSSPLENFLTESFVFVLKYLIDRFPCDAISILNLFGIKITDTSQLKVIKLETQKTFYAPHDFCDENKIPIEDKRMKDARPDIVIYQSKKPTVIEVKVEACLNSYKLKDRAPIDQIDFYENIKGIKAVYTLSKHFIDKNNFSNKVRWFQIYEKLNNNKSFVVKEFCNFLSENNMGERKMIREKDIDVLNTVDALTSLIKNAWERTNIKKMKLNLSPCITSREFGYYLMRKEERASATKEYPHFIGINISEKEDYKDAILYLINTIPSKKIIDKFEEFDDNGWYVLKEVIKLKDLVKLKDIDKQEKKLADWLKNNVVPVL